LNGDPSGRSYDTRDFFDESTLSLPIASGDVYRARASIAIQCVPVSRPR